MTRTVEPQGALAGVKVLDLTRVLAGPWATMTLGDLGAEIWKIEQPGSGDDTRTWSPPSVEGVSTYFLSANRNKQSLAVDLSRPEGRQIVLDLAEKADVVIENFRPSSLAKMGLAYEALSARNPGLIHCSISGYGRDNVFADRPGYDFIIQAEAGFMALTGDPDGSPTRLGVAFVDLITGMNASQAILAALHARTRTGRGQSIDVALFDSALHLLANVSAAYLNTGQPARRHGHAHPSIVPYQLFDTQDTPLALAVGNNEQFRRLCIEVLATPSLWADERYQTNLGRVSHRAELVPRLQALFLQQTAAHWMTRLHAAGVPVGQVQSVQEAFECEAAKARDVVVSSRHPRLGEVRTVRSPLRLAGTPPLAPTPPPELGQHTQTVLSRVLGYPTEQIHALSQSGAIALAHPSEVLNAR